jgi:Holliday junction resolvase RusA-like endonuclease
MGFPVIKITLSGSIRSKKNSHTPVPIPSKNKTRFMALFGKQWKSAQVLIVPGKAYKKWEQYARDQLIAILPPGRKLLTVPLHIKAIFYYKGPRPDLQGAMESLADCLEGYIYEDDKQIESWDGSRIVHDKSNPRIEIEILKYEPEAQLYPLFKK